MKIGLVCPYDMKKPGGVQAQVLGLAAALRRMGDEALVIAPGLGSQFAGVDLGSSVSVPGNQSVVPVSANPRVGKLISEAAVELDVLHVHEPFMPMVSLSALRTKTPIVATFHADPGTLGTSFYKMAGTRLHKLLGGSVRVVTAVSPTAAAPLPPELEARIIPNGVDVAAFDLDVERSPNRVSFLGRDEPRKGLPVLVEAWDTIRNQVPTAELTVMGADGDRSDITWLGRVDEPTKNEVLCSSAVFVAPNTGGESFGIVLVEAMAAGAAVVASDLPAFKDVAASAAQYFSVGDSEELASTITRLLGDEEERRALSSAGRARAGAFDWSAVAGSYRDAYTEALS